VHLLVSPHDAKAVPRPPIAVGRRYVQHINRTYGRTALGQPLGKDRFYAEIEAVTGQRREPRERGRPKQEPPEERLGDQRQQELPI
jgi:hypothetical protein